MINETMTSQERMLAAIAFESVDRHPVFPILGTSAPRLYGITQAEAWADHNVAREALRRGSYKLPIKTQIVSREESI